MRRLAALNLVMPLMGLLSAGCQSRRSDGPELRILAYDYGYQMPSHVPAGLVHVSLRNAGHDLHEATIARFTNDQGTAALYRDSVHAGVDFPSFSEDVGGARLTMPGDSGRVWLRLRPGDLLPGAEAWMRVRLEPGRYALLCQVPSISHGGRAHHKLGMVHEFVVVDRGPLPR